MKWAYIKNLPGSGAFWLALGLITIYVPVHHLLSGEYLRDVQALQMLRAISSDPSPIWSPMTGRPAIDLRMEIIRKHPTLGKDLDKLLGRSLVDQVGSETSALFKLYFLTGAHDKALKLAAEAKDIHPKDADHCYLLGAFLAERQGDRDLARYYYRIYRDLLIFAANGHFQSKGFQNRLTVARLRCYYLDKKIPISTEFQRASYTSFLIADFFEGNNDAQFLRTYLDRRLLARVENNPEILDFRSKALDKLVTQYTASEDVAAHFELYLYSPSRYETDHDSGVLYQVLKKFPLMHCMAAFRKARDLSGTDPLLAEKMFVELFAKTLNDEEAHFLSDDCLTFAALSASRMAEKGEQVDVVMVEELNRLRRQFAGKGYDALDLAEERLKDLSNPAK